MMIKQPNINYRQNKGAVLAVSLIMLIVLALIGTSGIRSSILEEKMSANMRDSEISFQSAEAALREAENWMLAMNAEPIPVTSCTAQPCVISFNATRYLQDKNETWWNANSTTMSSGVTGSVAPSRYVVEYLRFVSDGSVQLGAGAPQGKHYYRVTVRATGSSPQAITVLSTTVQRRF